MYLAGWAELEAMKRLKIKPHSPSTRFSRLSRIRGDETNQFNLVVFWCYLAGWAELEAMKRQLQVQTT